VIVKTLALICTWLRMGNVKIMWGVLAMLLERLLKGIV
jgi:hypothetical protein